jgi:hypothetical protein
MVRSESVESLVPIVFIYQTNIMEYSIEPREWKK